MKMLKKAAGMILTSAVMLGMAATAFGAGNMPTAVDGTKGVKTSENFENLFDGSVGTKWCVAKTDPYVIFSLPSQQSVTGYTLVTANDSLQWKGRNPKSWTLYGCNADTAPDENYGGWEVVHQVTDDTAMEDRNAASYYFALGQASPAYRYYMLQIEEKQSSMMQLSEFAIDYEGLTFGYTGLNGTTSTESSESSGGVSGPLMCGSCAGRGSNHCFVCQGSGISGGEQCDNCGGTGEVRCTACNGTGWIQ